MSAFYPQSVPMLRMSMVTVCLLCVGGFAVEAESGPIAVEKQTEANWVDARRKLTDIGPFMAYTLALGNVKVAKAISIRLGDNGEAAACFDAEHLSWRAAWHGGFIAFDGARYGLINWPKPVGTVFLKQTQDAGFGAVPFHYRSLRLNGKRVLLAYTIGNAQILETPWIEHAGDAWAFTRTLRVGESPDALTLCIAELPGGAAAADSKSGSVLMLEKGDDFVAVKVQGDALPSIKDGRVMIMIPPRKSNVLLKVSIASGKKTSAAEIAALLEKSPPPENLDELDKPGPLRCTRRCRRSANVPPTPKPTPSTR